MYNKDPNSNLGKLVSILHYQLQNVEQTLVKVDEWRDLDKAQGTTLDKIGENIVQPRGASTDEIYRILLKSKVARNLSKTDINTIIEVLALALDCDYQEIRIEEKYTDQNEPEPAALSLLRVPIMRLNEVGMSPYQFAQVIQKTVAAGVRVSQIDLSGTFLLSSRRSEVEKSKFGLSDIGMTTGGKLGTVFVPGNDYELPI
ncbi:hypothetical protein M5X00_14655 [Paenibacillus alvei]|uniref:hypothetical protein n=1 Tax=Paenibacillus alvei TaxID=44250 RepID=UPI0021CFB265|nr:hypothetical protein [Paenibacillus alvei]MCY9543398.1 hypothetical protein [Paenibacillus alvei]MCY9704722.1 hypothetical protein [Paenibacillus alvei]MCY9733725.1 hypothetical protein [Paenibacillus alvei]MCY9755484.1 hypothetical protein [Paenibacillus alvei]MEC0082035.1 hypothetical protein [Paenibacillus alvei]